MFTLYGQIFPLFEKVDRASELSSWRYRCTALLTDKVKPVSYI